MLGWRHIVQAVLSPRRRDSQVGWAVGAAVDGLHATSVGLFAALDQRHRRVLGTDAVVAWAFTLADLVSRRVTNDRTPS